MIVCLDRKDKIISSKVFFHFFDKLLFIYFENFYFEIECPPRLTRHTRCCAFTPRTNTRENKDSRAKLTRSRRNSGTRVFARARGSKCGAHKYDSRTWKRRSDVILSLRKSSRLNKSPPGDACRNDRATTTTLKTKGAYTRRLATDRWDLTYLRAPCTEILT